LKLAILMNSSSPWSREAALRLVECGHKVQVIDFSVVDKDTYIDSKDSFQAADIREFIRSIVDIHRLKHHFSSQFRYLGASWELSRILSRLDPDLLLVLYGGGYAAVAYLSDFRPYAVYAVGSDVLLGGKVKRTISRIALTAASAVMVNGKFLYQKTRQLAPRAKTHLLYLGTDTEKFAPGSPPPEAVRIVCTRGFSEIYNNEYLVRAIAEMPDLPRSFQMVFAGPGPLLEKVRAVADEVLTPERRRSVTFLGGVGREQMAELLRDSHIYVSVSRSDGTSLSLMEGLACGLFPILSDIPANREWISENAENGLLVPLDEPKALAAALVRAICNPKLRTKAAHYNRQLILERADDRKNMAILASHLEAIALGRKGGKAELVGTRS